MPSDEQISLREASRRSGVPASTLKRWAGHQLFLYASIDTWVRHYDRTRPHFSVSHADGSVVEWRVTRGG